MRLRAIVIALCASTVVSGAAPAKKPELTPMELQSLQSREYKTTKDQLFASIVSVFQDIGYQVAQADMNTGFISAESANKNKTSFLDALARQSGSGSTKATAFVEQMPSGMTRVRLNFLNTKTTSGLYGGGKQDRPVLDQPTYQTAFNHIEQALFERGALTKTTTPVQPTVQVPVTATTTITNPSAGKPPESSAVVPH